MQGEKIISTIDISHYMIDEETLNLVLPGDLITSEQGYMNIGYLMFSGHGTYRVDNQIHASQVGTVQTTNKLIIVSPLKNKYNPQIGDIVVGRVIQISNKRWKIDINASSFCFLNLNSAYLPQQRKKNEQDEFNMRNIMKENDMIVAEVHSINNDKSCNLHTRNTKYGKLEPGVLIQVQNKQVKKQKHHMISIDKVGIIMGNNGWVWLSGKRRNQNMQQQKLEEQQQVMTQVSVLHNVIKLLGWEGLQISEILLKRTLSYIQEREILTTDILRQHGEVNKFLMQEVRDGVPNRIQQLAGKIKH